MKYGDMLWKYEHVEVWEHGNMDTSKYESMQVRFTSSVQRLVSTKS